MINSLSTIILMLFGLTTTFAQHQPGGGDHKHASTHGGTVKSADNYHLELVQKAEALTVYLLDAKQKTLPTSGATATALLQTADGKVTTVKLMPMGGNQFVATLDKARSFRKVVVTVAVGGKSASASFDLTADAHAAHTN
ncbi:hypothetical protein [Spirosoma luteum]|uniref:hypothetical protein n=1 Tax=Spirosoma luteum TaxID=431553 RepID=UPI00035E0C0B|nr:hypothetical protein [Spirosoma luteum]